MAETSIFPASKSRQPDKKPVSKHFRKLANSEEFCHASQRTRTAGRVSI